MNAPAEPLIQAKVTPEMRQLLGGLHLPRRRKTERADPASCENVSRSDRPQAGPAATEPWKQLSLRRDGAFPARFRGALLLEVKSGHAPERGFLRLFATADGEAVAQLAYLPPESLPARPVFRAARVETAEALHRFIGEAAPALCLAVCTDIQDMPAHRKACDMLRLPIELPGLAARERPSVKLSEGTP